MSKSPSLRRIKADIRELSIDPSDRYHAAPLEHDMFEWHFTIRGADGTDFAGGVYHGRILLPPEYPFKPPNIVFLTPSGRFETGVKVCLSFSAHHPELWQPAWGIRLILEALISFLPTPADGAIGALDWTSEERKKMARESSKFRCSACCGMGETCGDLLPKVAGGGGGEGGGGGGMRTKFQEEIEKLKMLQFQNHAIEIEEKKRRGVNAKDQGVEMEKEEGKAEEERESAPRVVPEEERSSAKAKTETETPPSPIPQDGKTEEGKTSVPGLEEEEDGEEDRSRLRQGSADDDDVRRNSTLPEEAVRSADVPRAAPSLVLPAASDAGSSEAAAAVETPAVVDIDRAPDDAAIANDWVVVERPFLVSDALLNGLIGFFSVVVIALLRQAQTLVDELYSLGGESSVGGDAEG